MSWSDVLGQQALVAVLAAAVRLAAPLAVAAAVECLCQRSGVFNLGLEGFFLMGALAYFMTGASTGHAWVGVVMAILVGVVLAALTGLLIITVGVDQIIAGITIVLLCTGLTSFLYLRVYGITGTPPASSGMSTWRVPLLSDIPGLGAVLFDQTPLVYLALVVPFVVWWVLARTAYGLRVRAVGDSPAVADEVGVGVLRARWVALLCSGAAAAFAGALVVDGLGLFREGITAGRGWIALAVVILARWNPIGALAGSLFFGLVDGLQLRVQAVSGGINSSVPYELFAALPYLATFLVVVIATARMRRSREPRVLGVPFTPAR
jgi:ABC-type uncharacterized transport system permease subunit